MIFLLSFAPKEISFEVKKSSLNIYLVSKRKTTDNIMDEHVDFLELPTSIINALVRAKINTIGELCDKTYLDIYAIRNIGEISFKEIVAAMKVYNLCFKKEN